MDKTPVTFCRRIELDHVNNSKLRSIHPTINSDECGIRFIESETINECVRRERYGRPAEYIYIGTRNVYRVEDEKKFFLLLIRTGIEYKDLDPNSYSLSDND